MIRLIFWGLVLLFVAPGLVGILLGAGMCTVMILWEIIKCIFPWIFWGGIILVVIGILGK